jgi:hypothetical protein
MQINLEANYCGDESSLNQSLSKSTSNLFSAQKSLNFQSVNSSNQFGRNKHSEKNLRIDAWNKTAQYHKEKQGRKQSPNVFAKNRRSMESAS